MIYFLLAVLLSVFFTLIVKSLAQKLRVVDVPDEARKQHIGTIPLLGGMGIFVSFWVVVFYLFNFSNNKLKCKIN